MMRVCMVVPRYPPTIYGGGEISCSLLVKELAKYVDIEVISFDGNKTQERLVDGINVRRIKISEQSKLFINLKSYKFLKREIENYEIFHTYNMVLLPATGHLSKKCNIKSVATLNGIVFSPSMSIYSVSKYISPKFYRNKFLMKYIKNIRKYVTLCPFYRDQWIKDGISKYRISIIPNMINPNFSQKLKKNKEEDIVRILFVGNYARWRGMDILLKAYSRLEKQDIELLIVGKGWKKLLNHWMRKTKNEIKYLNGISNEKMSEIYSVADIFVQPYIYPVPIGRTLLEAMQSELAIITTGNDYYSPIIRNKEDGLLIYPIDAKVLAEKLQILIDDEILRKKLSLNAKKRVFEVCSPDKIANRYLKVYEEVAR